MTGSWKSSNMVALHGLNYIVQQSESEWIRMSFIVKYAYKYKEFVLMMEASSAQKE